PTRKLRGFEVPSGWGATLLFQCDGVLYNQCLKQLKAWDMASWQPIPINPPAQPASVAWEWDPGHGAAYAKDPGQRTVTLFSLPYFQLRSTIHLDGPMSLIGMSNDRRELGIVFQEGTSYKVLVWDLTQNSQIGTLGEFTGPIRRLIFSADGALLAASSQDGEI